jgi:hypothetical protein
MDSKKLTTGGCRWRWPSRSRGAGGSTPTALRLTGNSCHLIAIIRMIVLGPEPAVGWWLRGLGVFGRLVPWDEPAGRSSARRR